MQAIEIHSKKIFRCPHCSNEVPMELVTEAYGREIKYIGKNDFEIIKAIAEIGRTEGVPPKTREFTEPEVFTIYKCPTCEDITILKKSYENVTIEDLKEPDFVEKNQIIIYPITKILNDNIIPVDVCNMYNEASKLKPISPNSFATTIRRAIEYICDEQGAKASDNIYNKLEELSKKGILPRNVIDMGHIIRKVAKYGGHPKDEEITSTDADLLDDIFSLILEYIYVTPHKVKMLEDKFKKVNKQ